MSTSDMSTSDMSTFAVCCPKCGHVGSRRAPHYNLHEVLREPEIIPQRGDWAAGVFCCGGCGGGFYGMSSVAGVYVTNFFRDGKPFEPADAVWMYRVGQPGFAASRIIEAALRRRMDDAFEVGGGVLTREAIEEVQRTVRSYLDELKRRRFINVFCDESVNTPERLADGYLTVSFELDRDDG